jgi:hypothetical protein
MNRLEPVASCVAPGGQPVLFHVPADRVPTWGVIDRYGREQVRTSSLGVAVTAARRVLAEQGEVWVRRVGRHLRPHRPAQGRHGHALVPLDPDHCRSLGGSTVMTTTEPNIDAGTDATTTGEPSLCWLNLADLAPHPDNPRTSLGDLTELVRSIRSHGILEPLVVLPADDDGRYRIVAGHRRYAAGLEAGVTDVPAVVRPLSPIEAVEAMLSENVNRSDLTVSEEVRAIERLMSFGRGADAGEAVPPGRPLPAVGAVTDGGHHSSGPVAGRTRHR